MFNKRESWKSRIGFIFAALGSAVGLGSIWRFPYIVGENGGAAFIITYVFFLILIGFPVLIAEILIGRTAQLNPSGAFNSIGKKLFWKNCGKMTIITGFVISSFYSVVAGWSLGYLIQALFGNLTKFNFSIQSLQYFVSLSSSTSWCVGYHFFFLIISLGILFSGVRKGIEAGSKIMMPLLFVVLIILVGKGLCMPGASKGLRFLFSPDWSSLTSKGILVALGQAFFTLSLGQGTMVTYGSYLSKKVDLPNTCFPVVLLNTAIALLMGIAIFTIVFSVNLAPTSGAALIFETLPIVFSQITFGNFVAILFFFLVTLAAVTSEISALEPVISYLIDEKKWKRKKAVIVSISGAFLLGIPSALSFGVLKNYKIYGQTFFDWISFISVNVFVPLGGLAAVILVAWRWGINNAFENMKVHDNPYFHSKPILSYYFRFTLKYLAPFLILFILLCDLVSFFFPLVG